MKPNFYSTTNLDRMDRFRGDTKWLEQQLLDGRSRLLPVWRNKHLVSSQQVPLSFPVTTAGELLPLADEQIMLGMDLAGHCWFALDLSNTEDPLQLACLKDQGEFQDLRTIGPLLDHDTGALLAYARGMFHWHQNHRFCGHCGSPTLTGYAGHIRECSNSQCLKPQYPRTDPAVIMLIHDGDYCLLGRQALWTPGMHSVLAGYVEIGESLEEAVAREVEEEAGIKISGITYHSSQPWPFPASIMLGFFAQAESRELNIDTKELESAAWFHRDELLNSPENEQFHLARRDSIARRLINDWLNKTF